jgi:hypothetical protein
VINYRMMKEVAKGFLSEYFDLRPEHVRVGLVKYGDEVEVPIPIGDYDSPAELLVRIGETPRMRGAANLGHALREAFSEFLLSGVDGVTKVVVIWKSGNSRFDF